VVRLVGQKHGLWRVAEDDPDSDLYAESSNADTVMDYITAHACESAHLNLSCL